MRRRVLVLLLSAALALAALAPRASAPVVRPRYAEGDSWTYRMELAGFLNLSFEGNATVEAGEVVPVDVQGASVAALELFLSGEGRIAGELPSVGTVSGTWTIAGTDYWEDGAWKTVRSYLRLRANGQIGGPAPFPFTFETTNRTTTRILADDWPWPILAGDTGFVEATWNSTLNVTVVFGGVPQSNVTWFDGTFDAQYEALRTERITVPAGTFDTVLVNESLLGGGYRLRWLSDRAGHHVKQEEHDGTGALLVSTELKSFRYAAGVPPPPFPWLPAIVGALAAATLALAAVVAVVRRRRRPAVTVWMPSPAENRKGGPGPSP